jgi:hypothetical protein
MFIMFINILELHNLLYYSISLFMVLILIFLLLIMNCLLIYEMFIIFMK